MSLFPAGTTPHLDGTVLSPVIDEMAPIVVDDVADGDLSEYSDTGNGITVVSGATYSGGYGIQLAVNTDRSTNPMASMAGLQVYPRIGDTFAIRWHLGDPANHADTGATLDGIWDFEFSLVNKDSPIFELDHDIGAGTSNIRYAEPAPNENLGGSTLSWSANTWYETRIRWLHSGVFAVEIYDVDSGTRVARYDSSGNANFAGVGGGISIDMKGLNQTVVVDRVELTDRDGWPAHVVDGFEDGTLTDYSRVDSAYSVTADAAKTGQYGARATTGSSGASLISLPGQGLSTYPNAGETVRVDFRFESASSYLALLLGAQDTSGDAQYDIRFHQGFGELIVALNSGPTDVLGQTSVNWDVGTTYRAEITWTTNGVFKVVVEDRDNQEHHVSLDTSNSPDQTFTEGGYGFYTSPNTDVTFDTVELIDKDTLLDDSPRVARDTIDSFEDGDMAEYTTYSGANGVFDPTTSPNAVDGDYVCEIRNSSDGSGAIDVVNSLSGLPVYPSRGDTFGCYVSTKFSSTKASVAWAAQEDRNFYPNGYHVWVDGRDDTMELVKFDQNHNRSTLASASFDPTAWDNGEMCWLEIGFGSPTITATLYDSNDNRIQQISGDDTQWDTGGLGFGMEKGTSSSTTSEVYFDWFYREQN